jgi:non-homologous end joining protein Ku
MRVAIAMLLAGLVLGAEAADAQKPEPADKDNFFKRAAKVIGHDAKTGAKEAAQSAKQTGKAIGHGTAKTVTDIGHAMKESAEKTKKAAKDTFK